MKLSDLPWHRADMVMAKARAGALKTVVDALLEDLRSGDPEKRQAAIEILRELGIFPPLSSLADVMRAARGTDA